MAYGLEYFFEYRDKENILQRLEILKDGFSDPETLIPTATGTPVILHHLGQKNVIPIIQGSELIFRFFSFERGEYNDLMEAAYKDRKIKYWQGSTLVFEGYLKPENIVTDKMSDAYVIELSATDALADLRQTEFKNVSDSSIINGKYTGLEILKYALEHTGIELDFKIQLGTYESTYMAATELALDKIEVNSLRFLKQDGDKTEIMSCHAVIEAILGRYNCTLSQTDGYYKITNKHELNSYEFLFAWSDLSQTSRTATDNIVDITNYEFKKGVPQEKIHPLNRVEMKFLNKDLGGDLTGGRDLTDWDANWNVQFYNDSVTDGVITLTSKSSSEDNYVELSADFNASDTTGNDYIKLTFDHIISSYIGTGTPTIKLKIEVTRPDETIAPIYLTSCYESWSQFESALNNTFKITQDGDYNIKITFIPDPYSPWDWDSVNPIIFFKLKDVHITKVFNPLEEETIDNVTFDKYYKQVSDQGIGVHEAEILLADSLQTTEIGALLYDNSGTYVNTADWRTYGNTEDIKLIDIYARNILNDRYDYKDYWRIEIFDAGDINLDNILQFYDDYFVFVEFSKDFKKNIISGAIVQLLTTRQSYSPISELSLGTVNGKLVRSVEISTSSFVNNPVHNDLTGLQGGQAGQYSHLTNAELANVQALDSMAYVPTTDYYTKVNLDAGQLDNRYYTETELDAGQLDNRYYTETEVNTWRNSVTQEEMGWLHGITSDVQTQITARAIISGTPANDQIAVWTGATSIEGSNNLVFTATGLGVGTVSPLNRLHLKMGTNLNLILGNQNVQSGADAMSIVSINDAYNANIPLEFHGSKFYFHSGNVGIGDFSPSYKLDVNGTGRFTGDLYGDANIENLSFVSGFQGDKWQITEDGNSEWEDVFIRGGLTVWELIINQLHYQCGGLIIGAGGGKVSEVVDDTVNAEQLFFEDPEGNNIVPFTVGAIIMVQDVDLDRTTVVKRYVRQVSALTDVDGKWRIDLTTTAGAPANTGTFAKGDEVVAIGHVSNAALDSFLYMSAVDSNNPFLRVMDGVDSWAKFSLGSNTALKLQLGNLNGTYGYSSEIYGFAAGDPNEEYMTVDPTNGIRFFNDAGTKVAELAGSSFLVGTDGSNRIEFDGTTFTIVATTYDLSASNLSITSTTGIEIGNDFWKNDKTFQFGGGILNGTDSTVNIAGLTIVSNKMYVGTGTFNNANTSYYVDNAGQFSLKDQFSWDGTDLSVKGTISATMAGGNEGLKIYTNQIWENEYDNDLGALYINYHGYDAGITRFRTTIIGDGKNAPLVEFSGPNDSVSFYAPITRDVAGYAAYFFNDGNNRDRNGIAIQCGEDTPSASDSYPIRFFDGNGGAVGYIRWDDTDIGFTGYSDIRLKENIKDYNINGLNIIEQMQYRSFNWKKDKKEVKSEIHGWVADEVEKIYPEMVSVDLETGYKMIAPSRLIPVMMSAIKELNEKVKILESNN